MQSMSRLSRAFATNSTNAAYTSIIPTITEPVGLNIGEAASGIFNLAPGGCDLVPDSVYVKFFGAGADNTTLKCRLIGWERAGSTFPTVEWFPTVLAAFTLTLSAQIGIASATVINTDRFADTIVVDTVAPQPFIPGVNGTPAAEYIGTITVSSPANDLAGFVIVPLLGHEKLQFDFNMNSSATNGNALFRFLNCDD